LLTGGFCPEKNASCWRDFTKLRNTAGLNRNWVFKAAFVEGTYAGHLRHCISLPWVMIKEAVGLQLGVLALN
jgi:hypothetical protein